MGFRLWVGGFSIRLLGGFTGVLLVCRFVVCGLLGFCFGLCVLVWVWCYYGDGLDCFWVLLLVCLLSLWVGGYDASGFGGH